MSVQYQIPVSVLLLTLLDTPQAQGVSEFDDVTAGSDLALGCVAEAWRGAYDDCAEVEEIKS